jgi:hypothetical protein
VLAVQQARVSAVALPVAPAGTPSLLDQLKQLVPLREAGMLTEEEIGAKKASILARTSLVSMSLPQPLGCSSRPTSTGCAYAYKPPRRCVDSLIGDIAQWAQD